MRDINLILENIIYMELMRRGYIVTVGKKGTKEVLYNNKGDVLPGAVVSKIPRITNRALPCWVRARILYTNDRKELEL